MLIQLIVILIVFGVIWWLVTSVLPMPPPVRTVVIVLIALVLVLYLLSLVGIVPLSLR